MIGKRTRRTKRENLTKTGVSNFKTDQSAATKAKPLNTGLSNFTNDTDGG